MSPVLSALFLMLLFGFACYLRRFSESRSSSGSTLSVRLSIRPQHFRVPSLCNL